MAYATTQNMIDAYGVQILIELTDRADPATGAINDTVINQAIDDATAIINSFIGKRYDLTAAAGAAVLRPVAEAIAYFKLHRSNWPDEVRKGYDDALDFLKSVAKGEANLDVGAAQVASAPADARVEAPDRMFSRETLKGL